MMQQKIIRVYLVDDHQLMLDGLKTMLEDEESIQLCGMSNSAKEALETVEKLKPDVVITDISMPEMDGRELSLQVKKKFPYIKIIALSMFGDITHIREMMEAGISGYVLKNTGKKELMEAIHKVHSGDIYYCKEVANEVLRFINTKSDAPKSSISLTAREIEIVKLIAEEYSNQQIAEALFISERTVETHRKNIFRKTETKSVVGLIKYALEKNIITN
ncbi:MAG TPA: response regulator transcription factor [Bacteroidia bacterium]|nr:response regulator transcription factor [Bacteroidia bacterium]HNT79424.1 response regulator transcription factor [Bacteroidia bacterium]